MPNERTNVKFPMWRKKVDGSMFGDKCTVIPDWVKDNVFKIRHRFTEASKTHPHSRVTIVIHHKGGKTTSHWGSVTTNERGALPPTMRLFWDEEILEWLKETYSLTYQRYRLRRKLDWNGPTAEKKMPFWEFIDIEYDDEECTFYFTAHFNLGHQNGLLLQE